MLRKFQGTAAQKKRMQDRKLARIETEANAKYEELSSFNYIKMHLPNHFASSVKQFGCLAGFSTDSGELAHVKQLKDGWRASNHVNAYRQILDFYNRKHQFRIRELNLLQLEREQIKETLGQSLRDVFTSLYSEEERRELQRSNRTGTARRVLVDQEDLQAVPSQFRPLLGGRALKGPVHKNKPPTVASVSSAYAIPDLALALRKFLETEFREAVAADRIVASVGLLSVDIISNNYLLRCYNQLSIPVTDFQELGGFNIHPIRCTGLNPWRGGPPRRDYVLFQKRASDSYEALEGRAVARVEAFFTIRDPILGVDCSLAMITEYLPKAGGVTNPSTGLVML